jgi:slow type myosin-binding protein C
VFVKKPPTNVKYITGYSLSLNCSAKGDPKPRISWGKRDGNLPSAGRSEIREGTLTIRRVEKGDSGVYICSATSAGVFTVEAATQLTVKSGTISFNQSI